MSYLNQIHKMTKEIIFLYSKSKEYHYRLLDKKYKNLNKFKTKNNKYLVDKELNKIIEHVIKN